MSLGIVPLKVIIFILGSGNFTQELNHYINDLIKGNGVLREDSIINFIGNTDFKAYNNKISSLPASSPYRSIIGSDDIEARYRMSRKIVKPYMSFKHYSSNVADANLGQGSIIMPGVMIGPKTVLGNHVLCKTNSTIGSNVQIGECSIVDQGAIIGNNVKIGNRVHIGSGAIIKENLLIGNDVVVNIGEIVTQDKTGE